MCRPARLPQGYVGAFLLYCLCEPCACFFASPFRKEVGAAVPCLMPDALMPPDVAPDSLAQHGNNVADHATSALQLRNKYSLAEEPCSDFVVHLCCRWAAERFPSPAGCYLMPMWMPDAHTFTCQAPRADSAPLAWRPATAGDGCGSWLGQSRASPQSAADLVAAPCPSPCSPCAICQEAREIKARGV